MKAKLFTGMCDSIVIWKCENDGLKYTWLNMLVLLDVEVNWNGLNIVLHNHTVGLAAKILKTSIEPADMFVYCCLVLCGDSSSNPEASCLSARLVISDTDQAVHLLALEPDEQLAEISLLIIYDKECVYLLSWKESWAGPKGCHPVLPWGRQH